MEGSESKPPTNQCLSFSLLAFEDSNETINDFSLLERIRILTVLCQVWKTECRLSSCGFFVLKPESTQVYVMICFVMKTSSSFNYFILHC